ncbi:MAG: GNAT family N-acetyltransferase [Lachnospiraceae bacterium]|nr:GNAT family N-acetyltransferase [Lachnospiraceae bacterium]
MIYRDITPEDDQYIAEIIRDNLRKRKLDIPGTVYFDDNLNHISEFYLDSPSKRHYYIVTDVNGQVVGGIGLAEFDEFEKCAELQKLYLSDEVKGDGMGYEMIKLIEDTAREMGYEKMYLETHTNLAAAIHIYQKCGFREIEKPAGVVHSGMNKFFLKTL